MTKPERAAPVLPGRRRGSHASVTSDLADAVDAVMPTGEAAIASIAIHILGQPRIEVDRRDAPRPRGRKAWGLLAFLLLSRLPASRDALAELLFGDADDPMATLRWNLAEIRRSLGSGAEIGGNPVTLTLPADAFVDIRTLSTGTWMEAARVATLGQGLLEGVDVTGSAAFEAWLVAERRHVAGLSASILREAATARLAAGDGAAAVDLARKLIGFDEFDEEAHALLIRALVATGAVGQARTYLEATTRRFERELGVTPTATLLRSIEAAPVPTAPGPEWIRTGAAIESLVVAGEAAIGAGVLDAGLEILRRSAADARESGDAVLEARALVALGTAFVHGARGRDGEGATVLHQALALAEDLEPALVAKACRELGYIEMKQARYARAQAWLDRAIAVAPGRDSRAAALAIGGAVAGDLGDTARAFRLLAEAAADAVSYDKTRLEVWSMSFLGRGHLLREEWSSARGALEEASELARSSGWMAFLAFPQSLLAEVDLAEGRVDAASAAFESAFALGCQIGDPCWEGISARGIGLVHLARGRVSEGIRWLDDARTRCVRTTDAYLWVHAYCLDALCAAAVEHRVPEARAWVRDLESLAARTGMSELLVRAHLHRAALGEPGALDAARLFAERVDNPAVLARVAGAPGTTLPRGKRPLKPL